MLDKAIILIVLAIVPVLLWYIPQTRRLNGNLMTALKTVPFGCLTMILIPLALHETVMVLGRFFGMPVRIGAFWRIGFAVFGIGIGILLVRCLAQWSWRKYQAEGRRSWMPFWLVFIGLAGGTVIFMTTFGIVKYSRDPGNYRGAWQTIRILADDAGTLVFEQASIHPFLAEYDYRLRFGGDGAAEYRKLRLNTGGRTHFNIYKLRGGKLFMQDKDSDYIIDPAKREVWYVFQYDGRKYKAPYPNDERSIIGLSTNDGDVIFHSVDGEFNSIPLTDELEGMEYYGCIISDSFYSVREKGEQPLEKIR